MNGITYNEKYMNRFHDKVVNDIAHRLEACGYTITYPDRINRTDELPDIAVADTAAIEVKTIKPSREDVEADFRAIEDKRLTKSWHIGGTLNPGPIEGAMRKALKQLRGCSEPIKIIAIASPLELQMSPTRVQHLLTGLDTFTVHSSCSNVLLSGPKKTRVPLKKKATEHINAVLYLYGQNVDNSVLWTTGGQDEPIYMDLSAVVENIWESAGGIERRWL